MKKTSSRKPRRARLWRLGLGAFVMVVLGWRAAAQQAGNPIQLENARPGTSAWLLADAAANHEIEGYANLTSVNRGGSISFYVSTTDSAYTIEVFRMGWYGGLGARRETAPVTLPGIAQPAPAPDPLTGLVECNWVSQYTLALNNPADPSDWVSGVYLAKLTGLDSGKNGWIIFVVRDDARPTGLLYQLPVTTFEAYNEWGGKSLYDFNSSGGAPALKVSFNRPYAYDRWNGAGDFFDFAYSTLQFLEKEGYDVSYSTSVDTHVNGLSLLAHKGFLSVAHDEYWSWEMRRNVTAARDAGLNLGFFGSNDIYWQIRFEPSPLSGDPNRTIVCYKGSWPQDPMAADPSTYKLVTTRWRDARNTLPPMPEDALIGEMYNEKEPVSTDVVIGDTSSFIYNGAGVSPGDHLTNLVGYEADRLYFNAPVGTRQITHSPYLFSDGTLNFSDITFYEAASGAGVFATGSMQWNWGLARGVRSQSFVSPAAQQITRNVLARLIAAPVAPAVYIGLRGAATAAGSASSTLAIDAPAGLAANDFMLAQIAVRGGSNTAISAPPGWSLVRRDGQGTTIAQAIYTHAVSDSAAEPSAYTWNFSSSINAAGAIIAYYGVSRAAPVDASSGQGSASSTSVVAPALTVPDGHTGDLLVALFATASSGSLTLPVPTLPRWSFAAGGVGIAASDLLLEEDGDSGSPTAVAAVSAANAGALIALAPQEASVPTPQPTLQSSSTPGASSTPIPSATASPSASAAPTPTPAAAQVTLRGIGTGSTSAVSRQLAVSVPAGLQSGDLLVAQIAVRGGGASVITAPAGWTLVRRDNFSTSIAQAVYSRLVSAPAAEPASYIWNFNNANDAAGGIAAYAGTSAAAPVDGSNGQGNSTSASITAPSLTVPAGNNQDRLLGLFAIANSSSVMLPAAATARWSFHAAGGGIGVSAADAQLTSSGPTGNLVATAASAANNAGALIALSPAQAAPTPTPAGISSSTPSTAVPTQTATVAGDSPTPTATSTGTPGASPLPTDAPTPTPSAALTATPAPSPGATSTDSPAPTATPAPTDTPAPTPAATVISTPSPSASATGTPDQTATAQPADTPVPTPTPASKPILLRGLQTAGTTAVSNQLAIGVPAGVLPDDLLIAEIAVRGGNRLAITAPAGWALIRRDNLSSTIAQASYQHLVPNSPAEPSSYVWSFSNANDAAGGILDYAGASLAAPVDVSGGQGNAASISITAPSITLPAGHASDLLIGLFSIANSSAVTGPPGMVRRWSFRAAGGGVGVTAADVQLNSAGPSGDFTATAATAAANVGSLMALLPQ